MNSKIKIHCLALLTAFFFALLPSAPAGALGDMLKESGWDRLLGTWGDQGSNGSNVKLTYAWKFEGTLIELNATFGDRSSVALIGVNPQTKEIYHAGADNQGAASLGKWTTEDGDAILELKGLSEDGEERSMSIRHHFENDDTLVATIDGDSSRSMTFVRLKK